jgi:hypothetical protein
MEQSSTVYTVTHKSENLQKLFAFINYLALRSDAKAIVMDGFKPFEAELDKQVIEYNKYAHINYAETITCFFNTIGQSEMTEYNEVLQTSPYFVIVDKNINTIAEHLQSLGLCFFKGQLNAGNNSGILIGGTDTNYKEPVKKLKVAALIHVYNEADIIEETINHLIGQGIFVHVIDNWSTDGSWEAVNSFPAEQVSSERFPPEGPTENYEWFKQLEHTEQLTRKMPFDWFIHYDADELRYSPWPNVSLQNAISFIDSLGYNAIDFTILDFRYTKNNSFVTTNFENNIQWFEFGKRPGHFLQVKGWKKNSSGVDLKSSGGHNAQFADRRIFPVKFLTKHYQLRSAEQARRKLIEQRLPRIQKEKSTKGWHGHIDMLIEQNNKGWDQTDLIQWLDSNIENCLVERISGTGIL